MESFGWSGLSTACQNSRELMDDLRAHDTLLQLCNQPWIDFTCYNLKTMRMATSAHQLHLFRTVEQFHSQVSCTGTNFQNCISRTDLCLQNLIVMGVLVADV